MRNIPVFTTEFGVASLILKEIPYTRTAYIRIQSSQTPLQLMEECVGFCRAAGAEKIYATGDEALKQYPLHTNVVGMECSGATLPKTEAEAVPVLAEQADDWRKRYNQAMAAVDNASYMDDTQMKQMLLQGDGYFVWEGDRLLGLGRASGDCILAVASLTPGGGRKTLLALAEHLTGERIRLEVASTNLRAIRLYESLGFRQCQVLSTWYKIL